MTDVPEPDRAEGAAHPRRTVSLFGQAAAEAAFLSVLASGRLHHAWAISGPRGVGKATLAWRIARHLAAGAPGGTLDMDPAHPVFRRAAALGEPRIFLLRRLWDPRRERLLTEITVDAVRDLRDFLQLSAADGGWRAVIVDAADEMNTSAANALLKFLEEPPARTVFLLVCHQPARLLPTIRSRCRDLRCRPLDPADLARALDAAGADRAGTDPVALAELAAGSPGEALRLLATEGPSAYADLTALLATLPRLDRPRLVALSDQASRKGGAARAETLAGLVTFALARLARTGASGPTPPEAAPGEAAMLARLAPDAAAGRLWAEAVQRIGARLARASAVNLDPAQVMLDTFLDIEATAQRLPAAA